MSSRNVPRSKKCIKNTRRKSRAKSSAASASAGERAWDYLLRRRAENINDRIHKTKGVEFTGNSAEDLETFCIASCNVRTEETDMYDREMSGFPLEASGSRSYVPNEGFWFDTVGSRCDQYEYDKPSTSGTEYRYYENESEAPWREPKVGGRYQDAPSTCHAENTGYGEGVLAIQETEEALRLNVMNYIEDARHAAKNLGGSAPSDRPLDVNETNTYHRWSHSRKPNEQTSFYQISGELGEDHPAGKHGSDYPHQTSAYDLQSDEALRYYAENRHFMSDKGLIDCTPTHAEDSYQAARETLMHSSLDYDEDSHHSTRHSHGRNFSDQTAARNQPNDSEDLRHLIKRKTRRYFSEKDSPVLSQHSHSTSNNVKGVNVATKQSSDRSTLSVGRGTLIHSLPYPGEGVEVVYTAEPVEAEAWLRNNLIDCSAEAVGFDIEWKPQFIGKKQGGVANKTAVLQLGVESTCLVLHLHHMKAPPKLLASILSDERILKIGSGILQDVGKLKKDTGLKCVGLVDTQKMAKSIGVSASHGLKSLAKNLLGIKLEKPKAVAISDWERFPLTIKQIHYAALDAWIGFKIYQHMKAMPGRYNDQGESHFVDGEDVEKHDGPTCCHVCGKKVKNSKTLDRHIKIHPRCDCGQYFVAITKKHKKKCPGRNPPSEVDEVRVAEAGSCQACGERCGTGGGLIEHIKEVGHVLCPFCTKMLDIYLSHSHIMKCQKFISEQFAK